MRSGTFPGFFGGYNWLGPHASGLHLRFSPTTCEDPESGIASYEFGVGYANGINNQLDSGWFVNHYATAEKPGGWPAKARPCPSHPITCTSKADRTRS